jgi:hypothetical protein
MSNRSDYTDLEDMLWDISRVLVQGDLEEDVRFFIEPLEDVMRLRVGFRHVKTGQAWWIPLRVLKSDPSPYKVTLLTPGGRQRMALGMVGVGFIKPEDVLQLDIERTRQSKFWEFNGA